MKKSPVNMKSVKTLSQAATTSFYVDRIVFYLDRLILAQKRINSLEHENAELREKVCHSNVA